MVLIHCLLFLQWLSCVADSDWGRSYQRQDSGRHHQQSGNVSTSWNGKCRWLHIPTEAYGCVQMPAEAYRCQQMPAEAYRCLQRRLYTLSSRWKIRIDEYEIDEHCHAFSFMVYLVNRYVKRMKGHGYDCALFCRLPHYGRSSFLHRSFNKWHLFAYYWAWFLNFNLSFGML